MAPKPITPTFLDIIASALMAPLPDGDGRTLRRVDDATPAGAGVGISSYVNRLNLLNFPNLQNLKNHLYHLDHLLPFNPGPILFRIAPGSNAALH
ncbi:hypothetical protein G5B88_21470 [Herbaspirillum seropedicae]|uniref:hypothetical protein n=1 Tax=Herbaspirillum seropedicae TaxID=964 RepID=UPI0014305C7C|nr:hypothetical protein [Herbaspirillum seropedicae]UMU19660.1 hypothetical protein G5B88_21470 [Herbaspirillum seropedicae]